MFIWYGGELLCGGGDGGIGLTRRSQEERDTCRSRGLGTLALAFLEKAEANLVTPGRVSRLTALSGGSGCQHAGPGHHMNGRLWKIMNRYTMRCNSFLD
ncbi:hypothetical protein RRG08_036709 [Elysia crispata]|uniref:Uncharacterized protein n=1 Tax=Elysia crispata TaxID=231223 RepID=A0AAE0XUI1_9GAST|nr:hypothetical protein RRG08_036709 [Elysia crispata]